MAIGFVYWGSFDVPGFDREPRACVFAVQHPQHRFSLITETSGPSDWTPAERTSTAADRTSLASERTSLAAADSATGETLPPQ